MDDRDQPAPDSLDRQFTANPSPREASDASEASSPRSIGRDETAGRGDSSSPGIGQGVEGAEDGFGLVDLSARYEIQERLGAGGMGEVWRAKDRVLERAVAIKRIKGSLAQSRQGVARFLTEARAIAAVSHPNIVQVHDFGRDAQGYFLVMEFIEGESLADRLERCGPLPPDVAAELGAALCGALAAAHARGIVHRDIKPANILLASSGVPKLGDFGVARLQQDDPKAHLTGTAAVLGTWDYMPLEQRTGAHQADARSDIWSLGATLYQAVTGQTPKIIRPDRIAEALRPVLIRAMEERPTDRYQSAQEFGTALRAVGQAFSLPTPSVASGVPGKCPSCGRTNGLERKFCGGCGGALKEPCLDCGEENDVWEQFCGRCGANLADRLRDESERVERLRKEAVALRSTCRCGEAIALLEPLAAVKHPRLAKRLGWVQDLLREFREEQRRLEADRQRLYEAAQQALAQHKYREAISLLEEVPEPMRDDRVAKLIAAAATAYEELRSLTAEINEATRRKNYRGLRPRVDRYLALRPDDERAKKLAVDLRDMVARGLIPLEPNSIGMKFVFIPTGEFLMGSPKSDKMALDSEKPQHRVRITRPFFLGVYPVTQAEYQRVMGTNPSKFQGDPNRPVEQVSWEEAQEFCRRLSALPEERAAGAVYRLPTEAQWEYACRAGTTTRWCFGDDEGQLSDFAWFDNNSGSQTYPVGQKKPNAWGLFDMHGTVWEWCADWFANYTAAQVDDPTGPSGGSHRVNRGGAWTGETKHCRAACRGSDQPGVRYSLGFRVSRVAEG